MALFSFVALFWILRNRIGGIHGRALLRSVVQILLASAVMGVVVALSSQGIQALLGLRRLARIVDLAISIPIGVAAFYGVCKALKVAELEMAGRALMSSASQRLSRQRARM